MSWAVHAALFGKFTGPVVCSIIWILRQDPSNAAHYRTSERALTTMLMVIMMIAIIMISLIVVAVVV